MNNELIGIISNEGELNGVLEDNSFNVIVKITEGGPRGPQGPPGTTTWDGITDKPTNLETVEGAQAKADQAEQNAKDYTDQEISKRETFVHTQIEAAKEWIISHPLDKYPAVTVVDSAGSIVVGEVDYISKSIVRLRFTAEFSGRAYLN